MPLARSCVTSPDQADNSAFRDPYYVVFSRIFEPSAQVVIDDDTDSDMHWGFANFDRLMFVFVPKFAYPAKPPVNDSEERLINFHGIYFDNFTANPLTFLADAYERFGFAGVIGFHIGAGIILVFVGKLVLMARSQLLAVLLLVSFARTTENLYVSSVLEFIVAVTYGFLRDTVVIICIFAFGRYFIGSRFGKARLASRSRRNFAGSRNIDSSVVPSKM